MPQQNSLEPRARWAPRHSIFFVSLIALLVALFELLRLGMILRNFESARSASVGQLLSSFLYGIRFDLAVACYVALPFVVIGHLPGIGLRYWVRLRRVVFWMLIGVVAALAAWDLGHFGVRLRAAGAILPPAELTRAHLRQLAIVIAAGLLLGGIALGIQVELTFGWALLAAALAIIGLSRLISAGGREEQ